LCIQKRLCVIYRTHIKVSINTFVQYTRFFNYGLIAAVISFEGELSMRKLGRSRAMRCLFFGVLALAPNSWAQERAPILDQVAKTFGIDSWDKVEAIRYTWNGEITGLFKAAHKWEWEPKTNKVSFEGADKDGKPVKVSYIRTDLSTQSDAVKNQIDPSFINDNYWTLFPFHAYWDKSASAIDQGKFNLPVGPGMAELVPVKYPADSGYTPGDTWDLYVGKDNRVVFFDYHRGGAKPPSRVLASWAGYKKAGPILFSTDHRGFADGKPLHIFISDVAVKMTGSDTWMPAQ
jgi:hypothetical protein